MERVSCLINAGKYQSNLQKLSISVVLIFVLLWVAGCATLQKDFPRSESYALEPSRVGTLARVTDKIQADLKLNESGFLMLARNDQALRWRLALTDLAEHTIDIQYFIWHGDESGLLLLKRLVRAADRGVRVRLLIDDILVQKDTHLIPALNHHPNFEIRVFNPWEGRHGIMSGLEFLFNMKRLNHRMHNKLMVADNRMTIVGGRNIGNEYFGLAEAFNFSDMDVLAAGPIARRVSRSFDIYWNSEWAYPGQGLAPEASSAENLEKLRDYLAAFLDDEKKRKLLAEFPLEPHTWEEELNHFIANKHSGTAGVVFDKPLVGKNIPPVQLTESLRDFAVGAEQEVLISSPYFIPDDGFLAGLKEFSENGVRIKILTNSLASTNHAIVHSAYKKYRRPVVDNGGELYEARNDAAVKPIYDTPPVNSKHLGLHSKVFVVDRHLIYIGSLNLDPRSIYINMEFGLTIDSPGLGEEIAAVLDQYLAPENSWRVKLDEKGRLSWVSSAGTIDKEPARSTWQRISVGFFGLLPIEDQL
jgi:putative cardiolipin synthase